MDNTIYQTTEDAKKKSGLQIPFKDMKPGQSIFRYEHEVQEPSLRSAISFANNGQYKFKFKVHKHKGKNYFEIMCLNNIDAELANCEIVESSPEAKASVVIDGKRKYPFSEVPEGQSFVVPFTEANSGKLEKSLRVACCVQTKKLDKRFVLVKHDAHKMFEVYHKPKANVAFFQPSQEAIQKGSEV